jgi:hypothetical protein
MSTQKQGEISSKKRDFTFWDQAISEAEDKIKKLRFTLRVYKQRRDRGDPWPGSKEQSVGR